MYAHPGKKLNFMGNELGQLREWDEKRQQDWDILKYPSHDAFWRFMKDLNEIYEKNPAFWQKDYERDGFLWLDCHQESRCIYAFERKGARQRIAAVFNFSGRVQTDYQVTVAGAKSLTLLLDTNRDIYGGSETGLDKKVTVKADAAGKVKLTLAAFSGKCFVVEEKQRQ